MITLWHNPRCSKSRQTLAILEVSGTAVTVRRYLEDPPSLAELEAARSALGCRPIEMMRSNDGQLMQAMADAPILIERPIAFKGTKAIIGRPPEAVNDLLSE